MSKYEEYMFFYFNDSAVTINNNNPDLCYIRYGVTETTNLMLYFNLFFNCVSTCDVKVKFRIDNVELTFSPEFTIEPGKRSIAFTYPMINTEANKAHTLLASLEISNDSVLQFAPEHIQIAIRGQNVSGSMKEAPHAEVEEIFNFSPTGVKEIELSSSVLIDKKIPNSFGYVERANLLPIDEIDLKKDSEIEIKMINRGYDRPIDKLNYLYNKDTIEIIDGVVKVKTVENLAISKVCEKQFDTGVLQELQLLDSNEWLEIKGGEFLKNEIPNTR